MNVVARTTAAHLYNFFFDSSMKSAKINRKKIALKINLKEAFLFYLFGVDAFDDDGGF